MLVKTQAIVISSVRYQEKSLIVRCFTASDGLKSYFVRDAFSSKKNLQKIAYFQPLTLLEIEAIHKNKGSLEQFKEIKLHQAYEQISTDIRKSTIALFLAEMLQHSIREEEPNIGLFTFLQTAFLWLDTHENVANFHLVFLFELTRHLGFYPDVSERELPLFHLQEGVFTQQILPGTLNEFETDVFKKLINLNFDQSAHLFHVSERQQLLKILVAYYSSHLDGFKKPQSLEVLQAVFS
ncbi:MAG: DNA repair protein RecO [Flavobacteriaceae bacterium]